MNKETQRLDLIMSGVLPHNFSTFYSGSYEKNINSFTWSDIDFNLNDMPYKSEIAIIVTSYHGQLLWLKPTLTSYRKTGCFTILSYDSNLYPWERLDLDGFSLQRLPRPVHHLLANCVVFKHKTFDADKRTGWFWDVKYAQHLINGFKNFKYVYCTNGDCIIERPEGMVEMPSVLGDGDFMSGQSEQGKTIHTATLFMKIEAFNKIMDYMADRMRYSIIGGQSPEALLRDAVDELKLKETIVDYPKMENGSVDYYCTQNLDSTWKKVLGFRNLYHEFEYRENNGLEPLPKEYIDNFHNWMYVRSDWQETVCRYYDTGDRRYLMQFWDRGKDSQEDRKFLPLEAYGKEPIYEKGEK